MEKSLSKRIEKVEANVKVLNEDMSEIKQKLGLTATKEDIVSLKAHFDQKIHEVLLPALNAIPQRPALIGGLVLALAIAAVLALAVSHAVG